MGVSEAGLQHEILRRAQDLLDVSRVQPGTDSRLFPVLFKGPGILGCEWQPKGYWLQVRAVGTEPAMLAEGLGTKEAPDGPIPFPGEPGRKAQPLAKGLCPAAPPLDGDMAPGTRCPLSESQASEVSLTSELHKQSVQ